MIDLVIQIMSYPFMVRAFVVGILVSLCAALLGVSLVFKAIFYDRRWSVPCVIWCTVHCPCM